MLQGQTESNITSLNFSIAKGKAIDAIVQFIESSLPGFISDLSTGLKNEDDISQECCIYLNRAAQNQFFMFHFQHKYVGSKRSSDFSIISTQQFSSKEPLFVIEAKRLPTPGTGREREYVQGNLGAIERFKRGLHGKGLSRSAIIGYVQKESFEHWLNQITIWINDLIKTNADTSVVWTNSDHLKLISNGKYFSKHTRSDEKDIELNHYWLKV